MCVDVTVDVVEWVKRSWRMVALTWLLETHHNEFKIKKSNTIQNPQYHTVSVSFFFKWKCGKCGDGRHWLFLGGIRCEKIKFGLKADLEAFFAPRKITKDFNTSVWVLSSECSLSPGESKGGLIGLLEICFILPPGTYLIFSSYSSGKE